MKGLTLAIVASLLIVVPVVTGCGPVGAGPEVTPLGIAVGRAQVSVNVASGAEGEATGSATSDEMVRGAVMALYVDYGEGITTTTDLTLAPAGSPSENLLSLSNQATDKWVYPRRAVQDNEGSDVTYDGANEIYEPYWVDDYLKVTVAQTEPATPCVKVYVYWQR